MPFIISTEVVEAHDRGYEGTSSVYDEVPHGVLEAALLHIKAKSIVHGVFKYFPYHTEGERDREREEDDERMTCLEALTAVEGEEDRESDETNHEACARMEHHIPPPEACVESMDFSQDERRVDEEH